MFRQLTEENIAASPAGCWTSSAAAWLQQGITLQADDDAVAALARTALTPLRRRPLRRTLQTEVEDAVAEQMLEGKLQSGDTRSCA